MCHPISHVNVGDYVRVGGMNYNIINDNCNHASARMMNLCSTKSFSHNRNNRRGR